MQLSEQPRRVRNLFKRQDVFKCRHSSHERFAYTVSVYHVLEEKECYPEGCIYFRWKCSRLERKQACHRKYRHPGKNCGGCQNYYDEKELYRPEVILAEDSWESFRRDYRRFKWWIESIDHGTLSFSGRVDYVKPNLVKVLKRQGSSYHQRGFLVSFSSAFLGRTRFEDQLFMNVSRETVNQAGISEGVEFEADVTVNVRRGRFILSRPRQIQIRRKPGKTIEPVMFRLLNTRIGTFTKQPERCVGCPRGLLVDLQEEGRNSGYQGRELICLEGFRQPDLCTYRAMNSVRLEHCIHSSPGRS